MLVEAFKGKMNLKCYLGKWFCSVFLNFVRLKSESYILIFYVSTFTPENDQQLDPPLNITNIDFFCKIGNRSLTSGECLEEIRGVGIVIGWIVLGIVIFVTILACCCCCCICKTIHKKKQPDNRGYYGSRNSVISSVA